MTDETTGDFFDMDGNPIPLMEWSDLFADRDARTISRTAIGEQVVITMWLGHDEDYWIHHEGRPRIFGTAVFAGKGNLIQEIRTCTRAEAEAAHHSVVDSRQALHQETPEQEPEKE